MRGRGMFTYKLGHIDAPHPHNLFRSDILPSRWYPPSERPSVRVHMPNAWWPTEPWPCAGAFPLKPEQRGVVAYKQNQKKGAWE